MCVCVCRREGGREGRVGKGRGGEGASHNIECVILKWQIFFVDSLYWAILSSFAQVKLSFLIC